MTKDSVEVLLDNLPDHVTVILDEAYYEFAKDEPGYPSSTDYVLAGRNVVGLRTLSKAYGLAGIRLGYGFAPPAIADAINRAREPFNVNALAQVAGVAALSDDEHVRRTIENNRIGMRRIAEVLGGLGAHVVPSHANFVFADIGVPAKPVFQALLERGIIVRSGEMFGTPTCIRVSVGTEEENETFAKAIEEVLQRPVPA